MMMVDERPLDVAKRIIKENYDTYCCGIFDTHNIAGDDMHTIYKDDSLEIIGCYWYSYLEVFGLSEDDFDELERYYDSLVKR